MSRKAGISAIAAGGWYARRRWLRYGSAAIVRLVVNGALARFPPPHLVRPHGGYGQQRVTLRQNSAWLGSAARGHPTLGLGWVQGLACGQGDGSDALHEPAEVTRRQGLGAVRQGMVWIGVDFDD